MPTTGQDRPAGRGRLVLGALLLAVLTALAYVPALNGGFVWDDGKSLTQNPIIGDADGLRRMWLTTEPHDYWPLTYTTLWIEWRIWGMHAAGYHATNVIMHVAAALLLWAVLRRLRVPGAYLAALFFALHPVNVESVAWITQRKNLVAMFFFLLSILCFVESDPGAPPGPAFRPGRGRWYGLSLLAFVLAMLGKGSVAPLPVVLLGIIWWRRRLEIWDWIRVAPFFAVAAILTLVNIWFQAHVYTQFRAAGWAERMLGAAAAVWFYLGKAVWPANLCFVYPMWSIRVADFRWWIPFLAAAAATAWLWRLGRRGAPPLGRGAFFAWLYFCAMLTPVMGFTDVAFMEYSLVADHYQHLALIAVTTLAAAALVSGLGRLPSSARPAGWALCAVLVGLLGFQTLRQSRTFHDIQTLYTVTLERNPDCWMAHTNLADELAKIPGREADAVEHYAAALRMNPNYAGAHYNLALELSRMPGRQAEAVAHYEEALRIDPNYAKAHNNLGLELSKLPGRQAEALAHFEEALRINPDFAEAHDNLGLQLSRIPGREAEALAHYEAALRINPNDAEAHENMAVELATIPGREAEALAHFGEALRIDPNDAGAHYNLAGELSRIPGREAEAMAQYGEALRIRPNFAEAHNRLGFELSRIPGREAEAVAHYEEALRINPSFAEAHYNLAGELAKNPDRLPEAIAHYEVVLRISPDFAEAHNDIAVAYAMSGRLDEAIAQFQLALKLDPNLTEARENLERVQASGR